LRVDTIVETFLSKTLINYKLDPSYMGKMGREEKMIYSDFFRLLCKILAHPLAMPAATSATPLNITTDAKVV